MSDQDQKNITNDDQVESNETVDFANNFESLINEKDEKINELGKKIVELEESLKRSQADFLNFKRRVDEERIKSFKYAGEELIRTILPVIDNFKRAFNHIPETLINDEWVKGVLQIEQQFLKVLTDLGVVKMECIGLPADYNLHEVIGQADGAKDVVISEVEDGYMYHDKVLRVAKVIVGNGIN